MVLVWKDKSTNLIFSIKYGFWPPLNHPNVTITIVNCTITITIVDHSDDNSILSYYHPALLCKHIHAYKSVFLTHKFGVFIALTEITKITKSIGNSVDPYSVFKIENFLLSPSIIWTLGNINCKKQVDT